MQVSDCDVIEFACDWRGRVVTAMVMISVILATAGGRDGGIVNETWTEDAEGVFSLFSYLWQCKPDKGVVKHIHLVDND